MQLKHFIAGRKKSNSYIYYLYINIYTHGHRIKQVTQRREGPMQSSWQNAPHLRHMTMAFKLQAQLLPLPEELFPPPLSPPELVTAPSIPDEAPLMTGLDCNNDRGGVSPAGVPTVFVRPLEDGMEGPSFSERWTHWVSKTSDQHLWSSVKNEIEKLFKQAHFMVSTFFDLLL